MKLIEPSAYWALVSFLPLVSTQRYRKQALWYPTVFANLYPINCFQTGNVAWFNPIKVSVINLCVPSNFLRLNISPLQSCSHQKLKMSWIYIQHFYYINCYMITNRIINNFFLMFTGEARYAVPNCILKYKLLHSKLSSTLLTVWPLTVFILPYQ